MTRGMTDLKSCVVHIEGEVAVAYLQRRCLIVDQAGADDVESGYHALPA